MTNTRGFRVVGALVCAAALIVGCSKQDELAKSTPDQNDQTASVAKAGPDYQAPLHTAARTSGAQRNVIRDASITVMVENLENAERKLKSEIGAVGGYVASESGQDLASEDPVLHLTLKVRESSFETILGSIESLGRRTAKSISATDITEQMLDVEARLQSLKNQEEELKEADARSLNAGFQSIRGQRQALQAQKEALQSQSSMSTIELTLQQKANVDLSATAHSTWGNDTWNSAMSSAMGAFRLIGALAIWLLVYCPIWLLLGALGVWLNRRYRRPATQ